MQLEPKSHLLPPEKCLPGRPAYGYDLQSQHSVFDHDLTYDVAAFPSGTARIVFGMGCFWGAERLFWQHAGVISTIVGYQGGVTPHPTYAEVCTGNTNHAEVVAVFYNPTQTTTTALLKLFWENHDPTQEHRQGNDIGTQYRSAIFAPPEAQAEVTNSVTAFNKVLTGTGAGPITTDTKNLDDLPFYIAEAKHQQYLHKNPDGYCNLGPHGLSCPIG